MGGYSESGAEPMIGALGDQPPAPQRRILIVEGDASSAQSLGVRLAQSGFSVTTLGRGEDAVEAVEAGNPHLVILDWDLPSVVTMALIRCAARHSSRDEALRLMAMSAHAGEQHVSEGLDLGLDDYVIKPYSLPEVLARVRALLRPGSWGQDGPQSLEFHGLRLETAEARAFVSGHRIHLRSVEFRLLEFLLRNPERAFSRSQLLSQAWGRDRNADERAVDVTVQRIRKALQSHNWSRYLQTVRGLGYRLSATPEPR
jgi:two-component system, OmpR family, phosphate regulon response regulator PhoB